METIFFHIGKLIVMIKIMRVKYKILKNQQKPTGRQVFQEQLPYLQLVIASCKQKQGQAIMVMKCLLVLNGLIIFRKVLLLFITIDFQF